MYEPNQKNDRKIKQQIECVFFKLEKSEHIFWHFVSNKTFYLREEVNI